MKSVLKRIYIGVGAVLTIIVSAAWNDLRDFFVPGGNIYNIRFFLFTIVFTATVVFLIMNLILELQKSKTETLQLKHDNLLNELHDSQKLAYIDTLTGIPNQLLFEKDLEKLKNHVSEQNPISIILIDLDNFGTINKKFGYTKGNAVLRFIAQLINNSMRRDEIMYTKKIVGDYGKIKKIKDKIFRMHQAGDEFLFVINGDIKTSLGFVTRLKGQLKKESEKIARLLELKKVKTGNTPEYAITFHASVIPLLKNHTLPVIRQWLDDYFIKAKNHEYNSSISWYEREPDIHYLKQDPNSPFTKAIEAFKII